MGCICVFPLVVLHPLDCWTCFILSFKFLLVLKFVFCYIYIYIFLNRRSGMTSSETDYSEWYLESLLQRAPLYRIVAPRVMLETRSFPLLQTWNVSLFPYFLPRSLVFLPNRVCVRFATANINSWIEFHNFVQKHWVS